METTIVSYIGVLLGAIYGLCRDDGKQNGNYYSILGFYIGYIGVMLG